ncbi:Protein ECT2 [Amphibalanus amphitrite]|uniref:Protein ECT2 n=1 Tax=Amphibalanus amphitrite TaxID=1232801 RepID=A0A6A4W3U7_AMPAM|nr:Protein ECT2 [Amphibalanus amphitrite]
MKKVPNQLILISLQTAVTEMKTAFTSAIRQLTSAPSAADLTLIEHDVTAITAVRDIKSELVAMTTSLQQLEQGQQSTRRQLQQLLDERDLLLDELCKTGSVSMETRQQLHQPGLQFPSRTSSGCHSNDSGLGQTVDKSVWSAPSDQETGSLGDGPLVSTMVQEYVNGLSGGGDSYDSDSSLSVAVTKSFALSTCLSKQCGLELDDVSESETAQTLSSGDAEESERVKVVRELAETERRYCGTLWTIQDTFAEPLAAAQVVTQDELSTLFPTECARLYEKHCRLLHSLEERLDSWPWQSGVGDLICRFIVHGDSEVLRLYTSYVNGFPQLLSTFYRLCRTSADFLQFLKARQHHPGCAGLDLSALLLSPVQRVPRYVLLLQQLLRRTPAQHSDHAPLQRALLQLRQFLARLNDSMEQSFQMVHRGAGQWDRVPKSASVATLSVGDSETSWSPSRRSAEPAISRRRAKLASGGGLTRPISTICRAASSSGSDTLERADRGATCTRKARRTASEYKPFDCKSLPHMKQRRRAQLSSQLTAARSETNLRERPLSVFDPPAARSAANLAEPSTGGARRLEFEDIPLDTPTDGDEPSSRKLGSEEPKTPTKKSSKTDSQTLPRGRRMVVSRLERAVTPETPRPPSAERARKVSLRSLKNMFSLKKRSSRSGTLDISASSKDLAEAIVSDQYTPLPEPTPEGTTESARSAA